MLVFNKQMCVCNVDIDFKLILTLNSGLCYMLSSTNQSLIIFIDLRNAKNIAKTICKTQIFGDFPALSVFDFS